jgi:uncharacterized membrane protein YgcG
MLGSAERIQVLSDVHGCASDECAQVYTLQSLLELQSRPFLASVAAALAMYPEHDVAVVILRNLQGSMPERFIDRVAAYYIPVFLE